MPRPRDPRARRAILDAATDLLRAGDYASLTMEGIARHAGVAKTTVYRRWPSKGLLVFEALFGGIEDGPLPDTGEFRTDLRAVLVELAGDLTSDEAQQGIAGLLGDFAADDRLRDTIRSEFLFPARDRLAGLFARAVERGEIALRVSPHVILASLTGALVFRSVLSGLPLDAAFLDDLVALTLDGIDRRPS